MTIESNWQFLIWIVQGRSQFMQDLYISIILAIRYNDKVYYYCGLACSSFAGMRFEVGWEVIATWRSPVSWSTCNKKHWELLVINELWGNPLLGSIRTQWQVGALLKLHSYQHQNSFWSERFLSYTGSIFFSFSFPDKLSYNSYGWNKTPVSKLLAKTIITTKKPLKVAHCS